MATTADDLARGVRHQEAGQWADAERIYRAVLAAEPRNSEALNLLGIVELATDRIDAAIEHLTQAIDIDPRQGAYHVNLGEAHRRRGDPARAIACNRHAVELQPDLAIAHANLGQLHDLEGDHASAVESFRTLVRLNPDDAAAHAFLGRTLLQMNEPGQAETEFRRAVELAPRDGGMHYNLAAVLHAMNRYDEAAAGYRKAIEINPDHAAAHNNLGAVMQSVGSLAEAEVHYRRAVEINPGSVGAYNNLGALMIAVKRFEDALPYLRRAAELAPEDVGAQAMLGKALQDYGLLDDAMLAIRRAIALDPDAAMLYNNLAICSQRLGRLDKAIELYRQAVHLDPTSAANHSNYVYALNFHPRYDAQTLFEEHCRWGRRHADPVTVKSPGHTNDRTPDRRLRIGYVSGQFRNHAVNFFTEPILASHDHAEFEVFCYASVAKPDDATERLRGYADHWHDCLQLTDEEAAQKIREDRIDILVDLAAHIGENRLTIFAHKPAPIQVTYIGYQNTTGMQAMDYRLTDAHADPPGQTDAYYTETLVRLPRCFFVYRPSDDAPSMGPPPAVENGYVTFGSFNHFSKVTPAVLAAWARLLLAVPNSRLTVLTGVTDSLRRYVEETFAEHGVEKQRVQLIHGRPHRPYLEAVSRVDIALDPFPFNGHTTTCDALWQGVPVVTLAGDRYASRFGSSAHVNLGIEDLIAASEEQYIEIASRLALDAPRLNQLRATLRERMRNSPLLDFEGFTRNLEAAYRKMWLDHCAAASDEHTQSGGARRMGKEP